MSRLVHLARIGAFGTDLRRELSLFENALAAKLAGDDAQEFGPLVHIAAQVATYNARPWDVVAVDPRARPVAVFLPDATAAEAIGSWIAVKNDTASTATITVRPIRGTIDGAASLAMTGARQFQWLYSNGAEWKAGPCSCTATASPDPPTQVNGYVQRWSWDGAVGASTSSTWTVPAAGNLFRVCVVGPGGGGGGGSMRSSCSGGGAGGGGAREERWLSRAELLALQTAGGGSVAVTAAGSGTGGLGSTVVAGGVGADGLPGMAASSFGPIKAFAGGGGFKGQRSAQTSGGGGGGGFIGAGVNGVQNTGSLGGQPQDASAVPLNNPGAGGGAAVANGALAAHGGCSIWGGGGGGTATSNPAIASNGGRSCFGGGGGGSGGSWDGSIGPGATAGFGGASGALDGTTHGGGGAGGATGATGGNGTPGIPGTDTFSGCGGGGGGSARNGGTSNAGDGGAGGFPGGGGGGGGARVESGGVIGVGSRAGNGAAGGAGQVIVESYL